MKRLIAAIALVIVVCSFLASCSSTTYVTSSWQRTDAELSKYQKVLVLGIMGDTNRVLRQSMEKALVQYLAGKGINAVSAFEEYGPKAFIKMTEEATNEQVKKKGFDGVITISLLNKRREKYYVPGQVYYTPSYSYGYPFFWGYYSMMYTRVYEPGYYDENVQFFWESNLYNLKNGQLIYSVQSKSFNPTDAGGLSEDYAKAILGDLVKHGIVSGK